MKFALIASAFLLSASVSYAQDITAEPIATPVVATAVPSALAKQFEAVCTSKAVKSKKLTKACEAGEMPAPTKKGDRFKAGKNGAEVTFLFANLELINN